MKKIFSSIVIGITALMMGFLIFDGGSTGNAFPLVFVSESATKTYDGEELVSHEWSLKQGELEKGHEAVVTFTASQTNVGSVSNYFTVMIIDKDGDDLSAYYSIEYEYGTLTVNSRSMTLLSGSSEKIYDGLELKNESYEITEGTLPDGHEIVTEFKNSITEVGSVVNYFDAKVFKGEEDVTKNFNLKLDTGSLTVKARPIVIASQSASKIYDGKVLEADKLEYLSGSLAENHILSANFLNSIVNIGTVTNDFEVKIYEGATDVTSNYAITLSSGKLSVLPRNITIASDSATKVYDGQELKVESWKLAEGELIGSEQVNVTFLKSLIEVGTALNDIKVEIYLNGEVVSQNYNINLSPGTLSITKRSLTLTSLSKEKIYDGIPLICEEYDITEGEIPSGQELVLDFKNSIINVGDISNFFEARVMNGEEDVTSNYTILMNYGTLKVASKKITVISESAEKAYDGTELKCEEYSISEGAIVSTHTLNVEFLTAITNVGNASNSINVKIYDGENDVTSNYIIVTAPGKLTVTTCNLEFKFLDYTREYDGTALKYEEYEIIDGTLPDNHEVSINYVNSITNVGSVDNDGNIKILLNGEDVTYNFSITKEKGKLEVIKRPITITSIDATKVYDGTELKENNYEITKGTLADNQTVVYSNEATLTNVGTLANAISYVIYDENDNDVSSNYDVTLVEGVLEITKRPITITSYDAIKVYDGTDLTASDYEITEGTLAENQTIEYSDSISIKNVGTAVNYVTYAIYDSDNEVTDNYEVTLIEGTLEVTKREITVTTPSETRVYDGTDLSATDYEITEGTLADNQTIEYTDSVSIKNVGTLENTVTCTIYDSEDVDVTENYEITIVEGTLEVTKREITVTTPSETKVYDGTDLSATDYEITEGTLADNQFIEYTDNVSIKNVGTLDNTVTCTIYDSEDVDVTENYEITIVEGTLEVTKRYITIESESATKVYDGLLLSCDEYTITEGTLADNQTIEYTDVVSITDVDLVDNAITYAIFDIEDGDVSSNYEVTLIEGTLEVTPRPITISTGSANKVYDGIALTCEEYEITDGSLVSGQTIQYLDVVTIINVDQVENTVSVVIKDNENHNLTNNYDIHYINGILEIFPREITITTGSASKVYDGEILTCEEYAITVGSLAENQRIEYTNKTSIINAEVVENNVTYNIYSTINEENVTDNYEVTLIAGTLEIQKRRISIESDSASKVYDGISLERQDYRITEGTLAPEQEIIYSDKKSIINVGEIENDFDYIIVDANELDVTDNYEVTTNFGTLLIEHRAITVASGSASKVYDGTELKKEEYGIVEGSLANYQTIEYLNRVSITNVDYVDNSFTTVIRDAEGVNVTDNYIISENFGTLEITPRPITIKSSNSTKEYDGTALSCADHEIVEGTLALNQHITYSNWSELIDSGIISNDVTYEIIDLTGFDVTSNYLVTEDFGTLEVTQREITISSGSKTKVYDGTYLLFDNHNITSGTLAPNQTINYSNYSSIKEVGAVSNAVTYVIRDASNSDVTYNYLVNEDFGSLEITKRPITVSSSSASKIYDGTELRREEYGIISGSLANYQTIEYKDRVGITNVGVVSNSVTVIIKDENSNDVTDNYDINENFGTLTITMRGISIHSSSVSKVYDGIELMQDDHSIIYGTLAENHEITFSNFASILNVDSIANSADYIIKDASGNDVTSNYLVSEDFGSLTITPRIITVSSGSASKVYDGYSLSLEDYHISYGTLADNQSISYSNRKSITNVGTIENNATITIEDINNNDVTSNYNILESFGSLTVTYRNITISSGSATKVYDGESLSLEDYYISYGSLADNQSISYSDRRSITDVGTIENNATIIIEDINNNDVTSNYSIIESFGTLTVTKRPITVASGSASKVYDGESLSLENYYISYGSLADNQSISYSDRRAITDVGTIENSASITIEDVNNNDVTSNYNILESFGSLTVTQRPITISSGSYTREYNGLALDCMDHDITVGSLVSGHDIYYSNYASIVNVGEEVNSCDYIIKDTYNNDVTSNYVVTEKFGKLVIQPRLITISSSSASKVYDAIELDMKDHHLTFGSIVSGQTINYSNYASIIYVGDIENECDYIIKDLYDNDVTSNYSIVESFGTLTVSPRAITVASGSISKVYDGSPLELKNHYLMSGTMAGNDEILFDNFSSIVNVDTVENSADYTIIDALGNDVLSNYIVTEIYGSLTITPRPITISSGSASKEYDGEELRLENHYISNGALVINQSITYSGYASIIEVGTVVNTVSYIIEDSLNNDVTSNYLVSEEYGNLTIIKRNITISSGSQTKSYDGLPLSFENHSISVGSLASGQSITYSNYASITNVGSCDNSATYVIKDNSGNDLTDNYNVTTLFGTLEITKRDIIVSSGSASKVYDGSPLELKDHAILTGTLVNGHSIVFTNYANITNVGTCENAAVAAVKDALGNDVTSNYNIDASFGTLVITPIELVISSGSDKKMYDGLELSLVDHYISSGNLASGDTIEYSDYVSITEVGKEKNSATIIIKNNLGLDNSSNYLIITDFGELEIYARTLVIATGGEVKFYDGTPLTNSEYTIENGSIVAGHSINYYNNSSIIDNGSIQNLVTCEIFDGDVNVTSNYAITVNPGLLMVKKRPITISSNSATKVYDGTSLTCEEYSLTSGSLAPEQTIKFTDKVSLTNAGNIKNSVTCVILDENDNDVSYNYDIKEDFGELTVTKRAITLSSGSKSKTYDGTALTYNKWTLESGSMPDEHELTVNVIGTITDVGEVDNALDAIILYNGVNVNDNFDINYYCGKLTIYPIKIVISTLGAKKTYDGTPLTNSTISVFGELIPGHNIVSEVIGSITDVGTVTNEVYWNIVDESSISVNQNYEVDLKLGSLEVVPITISIVSGSASKVYDGTELTCSDYTVIGQENMLDGHTVSVAITGTRTEVGESKNTISSAEVYDSSNNIITYNYYINKNEGTLTVLAYPNSANSDGDLSDEPEEPEDIPVFNFTSSADGLVYFKRESMGNYTYFVNTGKYGWDSASNTYDLSSAPFNPNYLSTKTLEGNSYSSDTILLEPLLEGLPYLSPNYSSEYIDEKTYESKISGTFDTNIEATYINYSYNSSNNYQISSTYASYENEYYQYVMANYLQLPSSTKNVMLELASENGLDPESNTIIEDVAQYISTAGRYEMEFEPYPLGEDIAVYFLTQSREGICQHFATAGVAMFRALGIPARYTTGYVAMAKAGEKVEVTTMQGHAWVEVYVKGFGWVTVEVTGGSNDGFEPGEDNIGGGLDKLTLKPLTITHYYDGDEVFASQTLRGLSNLTAIGYTYDCVVSGSRTEPGITYSYIESFTLYNPEGDDVTSEFDIKFERGVVQVFLQRLDIYTNSQSKVYDGTPIYDTQWSYEGELMEGHYIDYSSVSFPALRSKVGRWLNMVTFKIYDSTGNDVTDDYYLNHDNIGVFEITVREIIISTDSATQVYNGAYLTCNKYTVFNLANTDTAKVIVTGKQKNIGYSNNTVGSVSITNAEGDDVMSNYSITYALGKLTVTYK